MNQQQRLEAIDDLLDELRDTHDRVIIVEGPNDRKALRALGVGGEIMMVQAEGGPLRISERVHSRGSGAIILTDWDDKGETIAKELKRNLSSLCVPFDLSIREKLKDLSVKDIKDVQGLPALYGRLEAECGPVR